MEYFKFHVNYIGKGIVYLYFASVFYRNTTIWLILIIELIVVAIICFILVFMGKTT
jgi:hypothetical protein